MLSWTCDHKDGPGSLYDVFDSAGAALSPPNVRGLHIRRSPVLYWEP